jgi:uncharacterized membrane protein
MPIRINLLAEVHAIEDLRRRDPVKRAIWVGVLLVVVVLAWSSSLQLKVMLATREVHKVSNQVATRTSDFQQVLANQRALAEANQKLSQLQQLATNRMLHGTLLNTLQQTTLDDVQLTRLRTDESYVYNEEIKAKTNTTTARITPGKPASVTERIVLTIEARDSGANPGDQVNKFKQTISQAPYFKDLLGKSSEVRLANLSPPQTATDGKPFVLFTLECRYPDKTR